METARLRAEPNFLYGLLNGNPIACGVGACLSCAISTPAGFKLTCLDGPVFDLAALELADD
jgi:hypothetical protein